MGACCVSCEIGLGRVASEFRLLGWGFIVVPVPIVCGLGLELAWFRGVVVRSRMIVGLTLNAVRGLVWGPLGWVCISSCVCVFFFLGSISSGPF